MADQTKISNVMASSTQCLGEKSVVIIGLRHA
jgi:hypothetical protein